MNDLISRAALLKECNRRQETDPMEDGRGWADHLLNNAQNPSTEWECVEAMIENMPVVDAEPVTHAHWIECDAGDGDVYYTCSACECAWTLMDGTPEENGMKYCTQCGAKMDETEDR